MVNALILKDHGTNCEFESKYAFELAGERTGVETKVDIVHMNDLILSPELLRLYQILMFPGGFSHGDDTGSGYAEANRFRNNPKLWDELKRFAESDRLVLGVCNGFQVLVNLGLLPNLDGKYTRSAALLHNTSARYICRWVDLHFSGNSPWVKNVGSISLPIAHGEGRFYAECETLNELERRGLVAVTYEHGDICKAMDLPSNPNGSLARAAGITDLSGRVLGMMPHPERAVDVTQHPLYTAIRELHQHEHLDLPRDGPGLLLFINALNYFK